MLLILVGVTYLYVGPIQKWKEDKQNARSRNFLSHIDMELVDQVEVVDQDKVMYIIKKEAGQWWVEPNKWPTEKILMDALEEKMKIIIASDFGITSVNLNNKTRFQTGDNGLKVKLFQDETEVGDFIIGKIANNYQSTYISRENDDKTYSVKETLVRAFDVSSWEDRTITDLGEADTVILKYPNQEIEITNTPDSRGEVYWRSIRPYLARLNKEKTETLINTARKLEASSIPAQNMEITGLDKPVLQIQLKGEGMDETLVLGNKNPATNEYFVKKLNDNKIYLITKEKRDELVKQIANLR